jgi:hypothetical protein
MVKRRRFVYGMFSLALFGPGALAKANATPRALHPRLDGRLSRDVFAALRQETFTAVVEGRRMPFVLSAVTDDGCCPGREQFTVMFKAPRDVRLHDGVCLISHPKAGRTELFLQAAGSDGRSACYKAPFNLLS